MISINKKLKRFKIKKYGKKRINGRKSKSNGIIARKIN